METGFAGLHPLAKREKAAAPKAKAGFWARELRLGRPDIARFASYGSASHPQIYRSEVREGCRAEARRA